MNKNKKFITSVSLGTAAVWFSTHCGAGFASGTQELQYFVNHGWFGIFMPLITFFIIAITYYIGIETARQTDLWNYNGWSQEAFYPMNKFCSIAMEISIVITTIAASAASIAAGAALVNQQIGAPIWIGSLIMFFIITLLCIFGETVVRKSAMVMTSAIIIIVLIVMVLGLTKFAPDIKNLFDQGYVNETASKWSMTGVNGTVKGNFFNSLLWALTYAGFQFGAIGGISAAFRGATSKCESKGAMTIGFIINAIMLCGICLLIFAGMPEIYQNENARLLPTVYMVNKINVPILSIIYPILLFLALISTAVGFNFGMVQRLEPYLFKGMDNKVIRKIIISLISLTVCYAVSTLGLMWVVKVAYKYLGIFNWVAIIIPLWIFGFKNIKKRDKISS